MIISIRTKRFDIPMSMPWPSSLEHKLFLCLFLVHVNITITETACGPLLGLTNRKISRSRERVTLVLNLKITYQKLLLSETKFYFAFTHFTKQMANDSCGKVELSLSIFSRFIFFSKID